MNEVQSMRYVEVSEIHDTQTGLIWQKVCQGSFTIEEAIAYVESFNASTGKAWRLPTIDELHTLVDRSQFDPATKVPESPSGFFWSSTKYLGRMERVFTNENSHSYWYINFTNGEVSFNLGDAEYYVRLVRDK
jgi:hypothetical protein